MLASRRLSETAIRNVDPSANNNAAIVLAAGSGRAAIVEVLLRDERVDPNAQNCATIRLAASNGHADVVRLLLRGDCLDPSTQRFNRPARCRNATQTRIGTVPPPLTLLCIKERVLLSRQHAIKVTRLTSMFFSRRMSE